ncbi:FtsX-like permease family protein [Paucilactobacillus suebicus]|uniref:Peptide ABC transporter permease n=1 Tax=Paucilactobacillus suebicus DSM 5007 = KCTC 3549 TaxID=1423807 RepID=A0A0R1W7L9_9LACO|nr:FtsX-like permease family protein [Paucilactobacillus suebicus]KRM13503.1 peptide ABC transporter permease [Paucilactobacillus suebicus DSM 5007 = KCTC 3549]
MLFKLGLNGIKRRLGDYLILFSGLIISSAIFFLFTSFATDQKFLKQNISMASVGVVFYFGLVLLTLITIVYVWYAQSFWLGMRTQDYGMLMTFGAKRATIDRLILIETLMIQMGASIIGVVIGFFVTKWASNALMSRLDVHLKGLSFSSPKPVIVTLIIFFCLAIFCSLVAIVKLRRLPLNEVIHANQQVESGAVKSSSLLIAAGSGIILLIIGFYSMVNINDIKIKAIPIALVTITLGSYLVINSLLTTVVSFIRHSAFARHHLRVFTLGQLEFRIGNYTKMLTMVTILFSLSLGAITVGTGYYRQIPIMSSRASAYTMNFTNPNRKAVKLINQLDLTRDVTYHQITQGKYVYYDQAELKKQPFQMVKAMSNQNKIRTPKYRNVDTMSLIQSGSEQMAFKDMQSDTVQNKEIIILTNQKFNQQAGKHSDLRLIRVKSFRQSLPILKKLARYESVDQRNGTKTSNTYDTYLASNALFGGLEFMGVFLGIAFLTMLASCLMFKVLSGAQADLHRYQILHKIGANRRQMSVALLSEIGVLFLVPAILGVTYVSIGLQMFTEIMFSPYDGFIPITIIFLVCYALYYLITIVIYRQLIFSDPKRGD